MDINIYNNKKILDKKLNENSKKKWLILWAIFVSVVGPFLMLFMVMRRMNGQSFQDILGYWNSVMIFGGAMILLMP